MLFFFLYTLNQQLHNQFSHPQQLWSRFSLTLCIVFSFGVTYNQRLAISHTPLCQYKEAVNINFPRISLSLVWQPILVHQSHYVIVRSQIVDWALFQTLTFLYIYLIIFVHWAESFNKVWGAIGLSNGTIFKFTFTSSSQWSSLWRDRQWP